MALITVWKALNMSLNNVRGKVIFFFCLVDLVSCVYVEMNFGVTSLEK